MKILIVDDDYLVASSLKVIVESGGIEVMALGKNGDEAVTLYKKHLPDVLMMDIRMEQMDGLSASKEILRKYPNAKILLLTTFQDDEYIVEALRLGVKGYILKQNYESIQSALSAVHQNQCVFNDEIMEKLPDFMKRIRSNPQDYGLNEKEMELIVEVANGHTNKEIADILYLSEGTIRNYLSNIMEKLKLRDRTQLAIFYYKNFK